MGTRGASVFRSLSLGTLLLMEFLYVSHTVGLVHGHSHSSQKRTVLAEAGLRLPFVILALFTTVLILRPVKTDDSSGYRHRLYRNHRLQSDGHMPDT